LSMNQQYDLTVTSNSASILAIADQQVLEGALFDTLSLTDYLVVTGEQATAWEIAGGNEIQFALTDENEVVATVPHEDWFGEETLTINLRDPATQQLLSTQQVTYEVLNVNDAPEIISVPQRSIRVNLAYSYEIVAEDKDRDELTISIEGLPEWLSRAGNVIFGTPQASDAGAYAITITVSDGAENIEQSFTL
ncbi:MAG: hypothetical protein JXR10_18440, partial [Cyclobacteriaceae bacterium]